MSPQKRDEIEDLEASFDKAFDGVDAPSSSPDDDRRADLERRVWAPARRGARKVGFGVGKGLAFVSFAMGLLLMVLGGLLFLPEATIINIIGAILLVTGAPMGLFGGLGLRSLRHHDHRLEDLDVRHHLVKMIALQGEMTAKEAARTLKQPLEHVEQVAAALARDGKLERDVDMNTGVEVYRRPTWREEVRAEHPAPHDDTPSTAATSGAGASAAPIEHEEVEAVEELAELAPR